jgi:protein farnesyltransferase/geranylgeranyltransferase type-1 subunit alpha
MAGKSKIDYEHTPEWADVVPIPQNEGSAYPLAAIAYSDEYSQAMSYLRAVMAANEKSERVLQLTEHIIKLNPAHYTVWYMPFTLHSFSH